MDSYATGRLSNVFKIDRECFKPIPDFFWHTWRHNEFRKNARDPMITRNNCGKIIFVPVRPQMCMPGDLCQFRPNPLKRTTYPWGSFGGHLRCYNYHYVAFANINNRKIHRGCVLLVIALPILNSILLIILAPMEMIYSTLRQTSELCRVDIVAPWEC